MHVFVIINACRPTHTRTDTDAYIHTRYKQTHAYILTRAYIYILAHTHKYVGTQKVYIAIAFTHAHTCI